MSYLIYNDYKRAIQSLNLMQVLGNDLSILQSWQLTAQEEAVSYLVQKYNTGLEFTDTSVWDKVKMYMAADRVYLDADAYDQTRVYVVGELVKVIPAAPSVILPGQPLLPAQIYTCIANTVIGAFDPNKWSLIGNQYDLFYGSYPKPRFDVNQFYKTGDYVYWEGKVYRATTSSGNIVDSIQYGTYSAVPSGNYFPGDPRSSMWGTGTPYSIPANTAITDVNYWTKGDNRGAQLLQKVMDITIFYIHQRISPQNIPISRAEAYKMAIQWLRDAARGEVTPNLIAKQPDQGHRIRYGGSIRNNNHY